MSEAVNDAISALRDRAPSLPSVDDAKAAVTDGAKTAAKSAKEAVLSHTPSLKDVDAAALTDKLPDVPAGKKRSFALLIGLLALGGAAFAVLRRRTAASAPGSPSMYTPPLPKA